MANKILLKIKKHGIFLGKDIGLSVLIVIVMIIGIDILRTPNSTVLKTITLTTINQKPIDFKNQHQPVILYFWGSWCAFCRHTSPMIEKLYREGYPVVSIAMKSGTKEDINIYLKQHQLSFPVINDSTGEISQDFSVSVTPTIAIVSDEKISISTSGWTSQYGLKFRFWLTKLIGY